MPGQAKLVISSTAAAPTHPLWLRNGVATSETGRDHDRKPVVPSVMGRAAQATIAEQTYQTLALLRLLCTSTAPLSLNIAAILHNRPQCGVRMEYHLCAVGQLQHRSQAWFSAVISGDKFHVPLCINRSRRLP